MTEPNKINKIYINDQLSITKVGMTTLLFNNGLIVPKSMYSVVDEYINIKEEVVTSLNLFQYESNSASYEYSANLTQGNVKISGRDKNGGDLQGLLNNNILVFVNGYKLTPSEYVINDDTSLTIITKYANVLTSKVVIVVIQKLAYFGDVENIDTWDQTNRTLSLNDFTIKRYMFFKNGRLITHDKFTYNNQRLTINVDYRPGVDRIDYYRLPNDAVNCLFDEEPGYFSYGPKDKYGERVPLLYDVIAKVNQHIVRLSIDDVRPGFFIREEGTDGCLMIIDDDFETYFVKCIEVVPFSREGTFENNEYYLQVPKTKSILKYVSEFDLKGKLFPELLGTFQKLLLNETYDSIQRLKNIRSINKVDSDQINNLIEFMGIRLNIKNMTLEEKHALLEELTNFYKIVGTETSYRFYNVSSKNSRILDLEQLFTPIRDVSSGKDPIQRYVTFRTAEELGAKYHREYVFPKEDYGDVGTLANPEDSLTNMPRSEGVLEDMPRGTVTLGAQTYLVPTFREYRPVMIINDKGESELLMQPTRTNKYIVQPIAGPNKPTVDYGSVNDDKPEDFYDYGYVWEDIKGKWIEWFEWDRPTNWYPTNHVNVAVEIPPEVDYDTFMTEFRTTFYNIASAVLYIHNIIDVYIFGDDKQWEEGQKPTFGIMTAPVYHDVDHTFTNNPTIKPFVPIPN